VLFAGGVIAQSSDLAGIPPVVHHEPNIEVYPQNFAVAQDSTGLVWVGSNDGILTFDGERWTLTRLPGGEIVRSMAYDGGDRVYVGGYGEFGYASIGDGGRVVYRDLTADFAQMLAGDSFADIWDTFVAPEGVYFRALRDLFLYDPRDGAMRRWHHDGRFGAIASLDGRTILQFRGEGFRRYEDGEWVPLAGTEDLTDLIYTLIPDPEGRLLTLGRRGDWLLIGTDGVQPFPTPPAMPPSAQFQSGYFAGDGSLALGGDDGTMTVIWAGQDRIQRFRIGDGFIPDILPALGGGLLSVDDYGVHHIDWPSAWSKLGTALGLTGSVHDFARWDGRWYAITGGGVRALAVDADTGTQYFEPRGWTEHEGWDLLEVGPAEALLADSYSVHQITSRGSGPALTHPALYPRVLVRSDTDPSVVFVGTELGIAVLQRCDVTWCMTLERDDLDELRVVNMVQLGPTELLVASDRGGIRRMRFDDAFTEVLEQQVFGSAEGLDYGEDAMGRAVRLTDGRILVTTAGGVFIYRDGAFVREDLDGLGAISEAEGGVDVAQGPDGTLWAWSWNHVYRKPVGEEWRQDDVSGLRRGALDNIILLEDGSALCAFAGEVLRFDPSLGVPSGPPPSVALRRVSTLAPDGSALPLAAGAELSPEGGVGSAVFEFALSDLRRPEATQFQARLLGYEDEFSDFSRSTKITYGRLTPGDYRFEVRARDSSGRISEATPFEFGVVPPWYRSTAAHYALWLMALFALSLLTVSVIRARTRRLSAERDRLEDMVTERTQELESANRRLETMAHLDGLTGIANRRRLDDYMEQVWGQCAERDRMVSVLVIDVDHFKAYNDRNGHLAGDQLLKSLVTRLSRCLRRTEDLLARYGGEEFLVVLPGAESKAAMEVAESMRGLVEESSLGSTISIGVATRNPNSTGQSDDLIAAADRALYEAKSAGRNCVRVSGLG